jgi:hypothetical protein
MGNGNPEWQTKLTGEFAKVNFLTGIQPSKKRNQ